MSLNKVADYKPLVVIDVGTDRTKYTQPFISTYIISNMIKERLKNNSVSIDNYNAVLEDQYLGNTVDNLEILESGNSESTNNILDPISKTISVNKFIGKLKNFRNESDQKNITNRRANSTIGREESILGNTPTPYGVDYESDSLFDVNPNTIFDVDFFIKSFPTILSSIKVDSYKKNITDFKDLYSYYTIPTLISKLQQSNNNIISSNNNFFSYEFYGEKVNYEIGSNRFPFETIYSGIVYDYQGWRNIIDSIGQSQLGLKYYNSGFSETPVILTQNSLKFDQLQRQVRMQYEVLFEDFKCPYIMICSQALMNLYSYNQHSGIVVDIGESGTSISTIVNGFTQYDNSIYIPFISGRSITSMMALCKKNESNISNKVLLNDYEIFEQYNIDYTQYLESKFIKESDLNQAYVPGKDLQNKLTKIYNTEVNFHKMSLTPYLIFYPEIFKTIINRKVNQINVDNTASKVIKQMFNSKDLKLSSNRFIDNFNKIASFLIPEKGLNVFESPKNKFDNYLPNDFSEKLIWPYRENECVEKDILITETNMLNSNYLSENFKLLGLSHILVSHIQKITKMNADYSSQLQNVYFTGGVLKTPFIKKLIKDDLESTLIKKNINIHFPDKDPQYNFYKGANFFSKLPELENVMVSRKDYFEYGSEQLSYNYI